MRAADLRHQGMLVALASVALAATACGSSSASGAAGAGGTTSAAAGTSAASSPASSPASSGSAAAGSGATTSAAAAATAATTSAAPTTTKFTATGGGGWCKSTADSLNKDRSLNPGDSPDSLKKLVQTELGQAGQIVASAPSAIKPDVQVVFGAVVKLYQTLQQDNYDFTKLTPADAAVFDDPKIKAAETHIEAYVKNTCGIDLSGASPS